MFTYVTMICIVFHLSHGYRPGDPDDQLGDWNCGCSVCSGGEVQWVLQVFRDVILIKD